MTDLLSQAKEALAKIGKLQLGFYPTRVHKLRKISSDNNVNLYIKREDMSGVSLFGGNKIRKLQYLLKDAKEKGCDTVFTYGATQSNHVMQTSTAARTCGLTPVVWLGAIVEPREDDIRANMLLDKILGAEMHILKSVGSTSETMKANKDKFEARIKELEAAGHKVYDIPVGGSTPVGALGFVEAWIELFEQSREQGLNLDCVCCATGSTGTVAGLLAGRTLIENEQTALIGIQVGKKDPAVYKQSIIDLAQRTLELLGSDKKVNSENFKVYDEFYVPGYEIPSPEANNDIRYLARSEGIFTDPVYSGKAFHGMMELIRRKEIPEESNVLFIHTGGATALFSEKEIIGDLVR